MIYVTLDEFACKCCGANETTQHFVDRLNRCRIEAGIPFNINSGYRCQEHNREVGGSISSAHLQEAADIAATNSKERFLIIRALVLEGFTRIGVYKDDEFIHVDPSQDNPDLVLWIRG
jgi:uncharacterized protein YcbK (DUF882 family)